MHARLPMKLVAVVGLAATVALATGCEPGADYHPTQPGPEGVSSRHAQQFEYDARVDEIESLARTGDVEATAEATNSFLADLQADVAAGTTGDGAALSYGEQLQGILEGIDIDVHFGTDEKCDAKFNCTDDELTCVSVTWKYEGSGGGRNCYNFGSAEGN